MKKKIINTEKKQKKNLILPLFIIILMVLSGAGYLWRQDEEPAGEQLIYKDIEFLQSDIGYSATINNKNIFIVSNPLNLTDLPQTPSSLYLEGLNSAEKIYLSFDPEEDISSALKELSNLDLQPRMVKSTYDENSSIVYDIPLKTCDQATPEGKVIIIKLSKNNKVSYQNNCLTIEGEGINLTRTTDKLVLDLLTK